MLIISALNNFFRLDGLLNISFFGFFILNGLVSNYYGVVLDCSNKNCGGYSGAKFWLAINFILILVHFVFWVRNHSDEFSRFFLFRAFCVVVSLAGHLTIFFLLVPDMAVARRLG